MFHTMDVIREQNDAIELDLVKPKASASNTIPHNLQDDQVKDVSTDSDSDDSDSQGITPSHTLYTPDEERAVLKKLDRRLVLFLAALYLLAFLDRSSKSACQEYTV